MRRNNLSSEIQWDWKWHSLFQAFLSFCSSPPIFFFYTHFSVSRSPFFPMNRVSGLQSASSTSTREKASELTKAMAQSRSTDPSSYYKKECVFHKKECSWRSSRDEDESPFKSFLWNDDDDHDEDGTNTSKKRRGQRRDWEETDPSSFFAMRHKITNHSPPQTDCHYRQDFEVAKFWKMTKASLIIRLGRLWSWRERRVRLEKRRDWSRREKYSCFRPFMSCSS